MKPIFSIERPPNCVLNEHLHLEFLPKLFGSVHQAIKYKNASSAFFRSASSSINRLRM